MGSGAETREYSNNACTRERRWVAAGKMCKRIPTSVHLLRRPAAAVLLGLSLFTYPIRLFIHSLSVAVFLVLPVHIICSPFLSRIFRLLSTPPCVSLFLTPASRRGDEKLYVLEYKRRLIDAEDGKMAKRIRCSAPYRWEEGRWGCI